MDQTTASERLVVQRRNEQLGAVEIPPEHLDEAAENVPVHVRIAVTNPDVLARYNLLDDSGSCPVLVGHHTMKSAMPAGLLAKRIAHLRERECGFGIEAEHLEGQVQQPKFSDCRDEFEC